MHMCAFEDCPARYEANHSRVGFAVPLAEHARLIEMVEPEEPPVSAASHAADPAPGPGSVVAEITSEGAAEGTVHPVPAAMTEPSLVEHETVPLRKKRRALPWDRREVATDDPVATPVPHASVDTPEEAAGG